MKNHLTIGEVSKLKGVSVKSLRYYEKIGILPPAFVNPNTGYRYYDLHQLAIVDIISVCVILGIPLKSIRDYFAEDGSVNIAELCAIGNRVITERLDALHASASLLNKISEHITYTAKIETHPGIFIQELPERYFLTCDCDIDITHYTAENHKAISANYTRLYEQCTALKQPDTFNQGIIIFKTDGQLTTKIFLEIPRFTSGLDNLQIIPAGCYQCQVIAEADWPTTLPDDYEHILIFKDLYEPTFQPTNSPIEVQKL